MSLLLPVCHRLQELCEGSLVDFIDKVHHIVYPAAGVMLEAIAPIIWWVQGPGVSSQWGY